MDVKTFSLVLIFLSFSILQVLGIDDVESLIADANFESEVHYVETEDGYKLKIHRIKPKTSHSRRIAPVFFMHGLFATAADFLMTGADKALPYLLANNGYDVWLGNSRGSDHSLKHKTLSVKSKAYWHFSWHEIGFYDVPAMIDYMLKETDSKRTFYVGHSQGTTSIMVLLSMRPEYNAKIVQAHLMAPAIFMKNFPHPLGRLFINEFESYKSDRGSFDLLATSTSKKSASILNQAACQENSMTYGLCERSVGLVCGENKDGLELDTNILPTIFSHMSHSASSMQLKHYLQLFRSGAFRQYDHLQKNLQIYNQTTPPDYNLNNVKAPVYIYAGSCDKMVAEKDIERLREVLPNVRIYRSFKNFNHCDFNYGKNTRALLFEDILLTMNRAR